MTSKKQQTPHTRPLETRLEEWLAGSGYPLEMQAAQAFRRAGFNVSQGQYYSDAEMGKGREIDVVASNATGGFPGVMVKAVIECKRSPGKPWVLFTNESNPFSLLSFLVSTASRTGHIFINRARATGVLTRLDQFKAPERVAYGMTQGFTEAHENNVDVTYKATMSAVKAAMWTVKEHEAHWEALDAVGLVVFPVIVIDAPLFEYYLDGDVPTLKRINRGILHVTHPDGSGSMHVDIVTQEACATYAAGIAACVEAFTTATEAMEAMDQDWTERLSRDRAPRRVRSPGASAQNSE